MRNNRYTLNAFKQGIYFFLRNPKEFKYIPNLLITRVKYSSPLYAQVPWFPYSLQDYFKSHLSKESIVFEYGSGGSTLWFEKRVKRIFTVEHDKLWKSLMQKQLKDKKNCIILFKPVTVGKKNTSIVESGDFTNYIHSIDSFKDNSFDLVIVDGRCRVECILQTINKIKPGGILMLDDSHRERYQEVMKKLKSWEKKDFYGLRPFELEPSKSTIWIRP